MTFSFPHSVSCSNSLSLPLTHSLTHLHNTNSHMHRSTTNIFRWGQSLEEGLQSQEHRVTTLHSNSQFFGRQFAKFLFHFAPAEAAASQRALHERRLHGGLHIPFVWRNYGNKSQGTKHDYTRIIKMLVDNGVEKKAKFYTGPCVLRLHTIGQGNGVVN